MRSPYHSLVLAIVVALLPGISSAQEYPRVRFSVALEDHNQDAAIQNAGGDSVLTMRPFRSPALATAFSALVPGAGQLYAERYWTLPLIWGFGYWFTRQYIGLDRKYADWRNQYAQSLTTGGGDAYKKYVRDFYRDERDKFAFYLALTYVLNIVDAYVGASLYNFDVSEDLGGSSNVRVELRLSLH